MSAFGSSGQTPTTAEEVRRDHSARRTRFLIRFAVVEAVVLIAAVLLIYVFEVIDPAIGIWVILALAALCAMVLSTYVLGASKQQQRDLEALERR